MKDSERELVESLQEKVCDLREHLRASEMSNASLRKENAKLSGFDEMIVAAERERCAKVLDHAVDSLNELISDSNTLGYDKVGYQNKRDLCIILAEDIRKGGDA